MARRGGARNRPLMIFARFATRLSGPLRLDSICLPAPVQAQPRQRGTADQNRRVRIRRGCVGQGSGANALRPLMRVRLNVDQQCRKRREAELWLRSLRMPAHQWFPVAICVDFRHSARERAG